MQLSVEDLIPSFKISKELIQKIIATWWYQHHSGRLSFLLEQQQLRQETGEVLRIDHTYKVLKCVGVTDTNNKWVQHKFPVLQDFALTIPLQVPLRASLFAVLNEVIFTYINITDVHRTGVY